MGLFAMSGFRLELARFAVLDMSFDLIEHVWLPEAAIDGSESVVDAGMSILIVELSEGLNSIFRFFEYLANLLAVFSKEIVFLQKMVGGLAFDSSSVNCRDWQFIVSEILTQEDKIVGSFFDRRHQSRGGVSRIVFALNMFSFVLIFLQVGCLSNKHAIKLPATLKYGNKNKVICLKCKFMFLKIVSIVIECLDTIHYFQLVS